MAPGPAFGVLIEAKYARSAADFKRIQEEVIVDSIGYLRRTDRYKEIVVFIYDASASVQEHALTEAALRELEGVSDVVIVSRPSQVVLI